MKKPKQASGGARLAASGKKPITLGVTTEEHAELMEAAAQDRRPLTQFLLLHGLAAARKILSKKK